MTRRTRPINSVTWRTETVDVIASPPAAPAQMAGWLKGHWAIENSLHWVGDVDLGRRSLPDPHRPRAAGHGQLEEPGHQPASPGWGDKHRSRAQTPSTTTDSTPDQIEQNFAVTLVPDRPTRVTWCLWTGRQRGPSLMSSSPY